MRNHNFITFFENIGTPVFFKTQWKIFNKRGAVFMDWHQNLI